MAFQLPMAGVPLSSKANLFLLTVGYIAGYTCEFAFTSKTWDSRGGCSWPHLELAARHFLSPESRESEAWPVMTGWDRHGLKAHA